MADVLEDIGLWWDDKLQFADDRVKDWFLMDSPKWTFYLVLAYIIMSTYGPKLMESRKPMNVKIPMIIYNFIAVAINVHIFTEVLLASAALGYSYSCQPVNYSTEYNEMRIAKALWWFYFSKCVEFMDTLFFVVRKKNDQISFLHIYHHASMFPLWWIGIKWVAGGQAFFGALVNSFIHIIMYSYYGLSACGPSVQKYLWWKKYLTRLQLVQFLSVIIHTTKSLVTDCPFPKWMHYGLISYAMMMVFLFSNFYYHAYRLKKRERMPNAINENEKPSTKSLKAE